MFRDRKRNIWFSLQIVKIASAIACLQSTHTEECYPDSKLAFNFLLCLNCLTYSLIFLPSIL